LFTTIGKLLSDSIENQQRHLYFTTSNISSFSVGAKISLTNLDSATASYEFSKTEIPKNVSARLNYIEMHASPWPTREAKNIGLMLILVLLNNVLIMMNLWIRWSK
jgi:hypothetical protein